MKYFVAIFLCLFVINAEAGFGGSRGGFSGGRSSFSSSRSSFGGSRSFSAPSRPSFGGSRAMSVPAPIIRRPAPSYTNTYSAPPVTHHTTVVRDSGHDGLLTGMLIGNAISNSNRPVVVAPVVQGGGYVQEAAPNAVYTNGVPYRQSGVSFWSVFFFLLLTGMVVYGMYYFWSKRND